jgi:hypothetical protein
MRFLRKSLFVAVLLAAMPALAQSPPARVGRVSLVEGTLAFYQAGDPDWSRANRNLPVASGEWFATDQQSRAGLRIGAASVGIARDTRLQVADLREKTMQLTLPQGRVNLDWRRLKSDDTPEIDLSRGAVWLLQPGIYDIDSGAPDQPIRVTVFAGSARFAGGGIDQTVKAGETLVLIGTETLSSSTETATADDFSEWCRAHDYHPDRLAAPYHVSPAMTGYEELDSYGQWVTAPNYGTVWYPQSVAADWTPYREGHWVWIEPWGWNWVDDEPWGFAPFHYGRWARVEGRWAWVPGQFVPEPVYAPALVAFVALPVAAGPVVGWFPLAPGEVYWPTYARDTAYIQNLNIANVNIVTIRNVTRIVAREPFAGPPPAVVHQRFANLASAVIAPARAFATAARVAVAAVAVPAPLLQRAAITVRPPPVIAAPLKGTVAATTKPAGALPPPLARPHPPAPPNFAHLDAAPRVAEPATSTGYPVAAEHGKVPPAVNAARQVAQPAGAPNATGKAGLTGEGKPPEATRALPPHPGEHAAGPVAAGPIPGRPSGPPGSPDFSHLAPAHLTPHPASAPQPPPAAAAHAPLQRGRGPAPSDFSQPRRAEGGAQAAPQPPVHAATPPPVPAHPAASTAATTGKVAEEARRRAAEAAARQQAAQAAAHEAAARQRATQAAAQEAASRQQAAQQRAAQEAAGRQAHPPSQPSCGQPGQPPCPH